MPSKPMQIRNGVPALLVAATGASLAVLVPVWTSIPGWASGLLGFTLGLTAGWVGYSTLFSRKIEVRGVSLLRIAVGVLLGWLVGYFFMVTHLAPDPERMHNRGIAAER